MNFRLRQYCPFNRTILLCYSLVFSDKVNCEIGNKDDVVGYTVALCDKRRML